MDSTHGRTQRPDQPPMIREIAALTARLRGLTGPDVGPAARSAFLADKAALLARIPTTPTTKPPVADPTRTTPGTAMTVRRSQ